jgi:hypothetical protein
LVCRQAFAQRLQTRDSATNRRLKPNVDVILAGNLEKLIAKRRKQRLVGSHNRFPRTQRIQDQFLRKRRPANQFNDDLNLRIAYNIIGICRQDPIGNLDSTIRNDIQIRNALHDRNEANTLRYQVGIFLNSLDDTCSNGPEANDPNVQYVHFCLEITNAHV